MAMRPLLTIGNTPIPDPSSYSATTATTVDSGRNTKGVFIGAIIRENQMKVEASWRFLEAPDWAKILQLFESRYGGSFINNVTFFSQVTNNWETRQMYVSDRTAKIFLRNPDGSIRGYVEPRIALVEV